MKKSVLLRWLLLNLVLVGFIVVALRSISPPQKAAVTITEFDPEEQLLPWFKAYGLASAKPQAVVVKEGKVFIEFLDEAGRYFNVDPLAIRSERWGEHPADKVLRLKAQHGLSIDPNLERQLQGYFRDRFFHQLTFEHLPGRTARGVVAEIDIDSSFAVIAAPWEWRIGGGHLVPSFFHVNRDQTDPAQERVLEAAGYHFDPTIFGTDLFDQIWGILYNHHGGSLPSLYWITDQLRGLGIAIEPGMRLVGGFREINGEIYFTASDDYPNATHGILYRLDSNGKLTKLFEAAGGILFALPHPQKPGKLLISAEGYEKGDPRFQSLFELDLETGEWQVIKFPEPADFELYTTQGRLLSDGELLLLKRYGFTKEGGGIWLLDLTDPNYATQKKLVAWDHMLAWIPLPTSDPDLFILAITAKEVADNFAMTINRAELHLAGMDSAITGVKRIGKVRGWNPVPVHYEKLEDGGYLLYVEANDSSKSHYAGRPSAVYVVTLN